METSTEPSSILKVTLIAAGAVIIIFGMKMGAAILNPILLGLIIGISVLPIAGWMKRKGAPDWLAFLITLVLMVLVIVGFIVLVGISVNNLINTLPQYQDNLQGLINSVQSSLQRIGIGSDEIQGYLGGIDQGKILGSLASFLGGILGSLSSLLIMLMVLIFFLLGVPLYGAKLKRIPANNPTLVRVLGLGRDLREYVGITTWINFLVALVNTVFLFILGVDFAVLWGLLSFLTGYIPNVGFWIAAIPAVMMALLQFGPGKALIVLVGFVLINGGVQNFLQPKMMGAGLNLTTFAVTLSLFFWAWVLGPMGALLAVPMTMIVKEVFLDAYDDSRVLAELMSANTPAKSTPDVPASQMADT